MIDFERILQWRCWWRQYIKDKNHGSFPFQEEKREPIHVLMNGPSLSNTIEFIQRKPGKVMMVNQALVTLTEVGPDYYCLADGAYRIGKGNYPELWRGDVEALQKALESYERPLIIFMPNELREGLYISNPQISIQGVCCSHCPEYFGGKQVKYILQKNIGCFRPQGVIVLALYVAIQMGFKKIYLHGANQNELLNVNVNIDNQKVLKLNHFYEEKDNIKVLPGTMLEEYEAYMNLFKSLYGLRRYAEDCGVKIINMCNESLIDCFEKIRINN